MRILIISHDVVGQKMAGPGIRAHELARQIATNHETLLVAPRPIDLPEAEVRFGSYGWGDRASLAPFLRDRDAIVANAYVLAAHPEIAQVPVPLALDLYDPIALENTAWLAGAPMAERRARHEEDTDLFRGQLAVGDFFFCATETQRDLYLGALLGAGRLTPEVIDEDPGLRRLIDIVGFGLPAEPFDATGEAVRAALGIPDTAPLLLWSSGLWDWLDPGTLIAAMPRILQRHPETRLLFLAGRHPHDGREMKAVARSREEARDAGLLGSAILLHEEWIPFADRGAFLAAADLAICLHPHGPESHFAALRSRFLDHLWAGLPSVVSAGDAAAKIVREQNLGTVTRPGDSAGVADAVIQLLNDQDRRLRIQARISAIRQDFEWSAVAAPLLDFCAQPQRRRPEVPLPKPAPPPGSPSLGHRKRRSHLLSWLRNRLISKNS
ncbi:MAG: glycosyltransferase family 4 protein [bacterium]|jgi:glycosyltransferase involved in cell wall biosynthesis